MKSVSARGSVARLEKPNHRVSAVLLVLGLLIAAGLLLGSQAVPVRTVPQVPVATAGFERYLTYISTDKPIYRTGEKVYVRGVVLRAEGHEPGAAGAIN